jgi:sugar phosphate isomerase/epimerase
MLAKAGYKSVEGYGGLFDDLEGLRAGLDANGLQMASSHFGLDMIEDDLPGTLNIVKTLGIKKVFAPFLMPDQRPVDAAGWTDFGKRLANAGRPLHDAGIAFGWHNHAFEFEATETGEMPIDLIAGASDDLLLELDLGWVKVAGLDPVEWINKYAGRITSAHIKDIAPKGTCIDEDGWADVGQGVMNWPAIHAALKAANCTHYVIEHDNPSDHNRFATRSLAAVQQF